MMSGMKEEILDIVDRDENVIGQIARKDSQRVADEKLGYIRFADMFLVNTKGQIWTPIRTADKVIAPNGYDFSVGGHVEAGSDYVQTLIREAEEEINLHITEKDVEYIANVTYEAEGYKQSLYLFRTDITPTFNPSDFISAAWLNPSELIANIDNGHKAKGNLKSSVLLLRRYLTTKN